MENAEMTSHIAEIKLLQINFIRDLMCDLQHMYLEINFKIL